MDGEIRAWWASKFPDMRGQMAYDPCLCPWNRHQRRRHQRSKGIILNLYSGKDTGIWSSKNWLGYEIINVDITMGAQYDMHSVGTWSYLAHLARSGRVVAILGGPPCRSVSRLRHRAPGPRPVRGRDDRRFGLSDLTVREGARRGRLGLAVETVWTVAHGVGSLEVRSSRQQSPTSSPCLPDGVSEGCSGLYGGGIGGAGLSVLLEFPGGEGYGRLDESDVCPS